MFRYNGLPFSCLHYSTVVNSTETPSNISWIWQWGFSIYDNDINVWFGVLTLNAQPSEGWASSMYTAKKSATSLNSFEMLRNSSTLARKTGHVQLQKLTTSGRFFLLNSKSRRCDLLSTEISWGSGAGFPREADFCSSRKIDERMEVNMGQVNSECL